MTDDEWHQDNVRRSRELHERNDPQERARHAANRDRAIVLNARQRSMVGTALELDAAEQRGRDEVLAIVFGEIEASKAGLEAELAKL